MKTLIAVLLCIGTGLPAETIVAARNIPARALISLDDLELRDIDVAGGTDDPVDLVGFEARVALYAGRPIRRGDVAVPAIIDRNQIVTLIFSRNGLEIMAEGRALDRAGVGDVIRVMNLTSRSTVTARIGSDGAAYVAN